jgi:hypothetical protein
MLKNNLVVRETSDPAGNEGLLHFIKKGLPAVLPKTAGSPQRNRTEARLD